MIAITRLCEEGIQAWKQIKPEFSFTPWYCSQEEQHDNEVRLDQLLNDLLPYLDAFPKQKLLQARWKQKGEDYLTTLLEGQEGLLEGMEEAAQLRFREITVSFLRDVRLFDPALSLADAMQALRNVWIIAILQCIFDKPVGYHPAMFAYSMLYPYSDNYLDDVNVSMAEKRSFNDWFTQRLLGTIDSGRNAQEEKISALVHKIEEQFPRAHYPQVYEALLLIQEAQILSLSQQDGNVPLHEEELLAISYRKGGTSVLADGYLIDGCLDYEEERFCMDYGFMLQLGDDLQDVVEDRTHQHQTLLSTWKQGDMDELILRLLQDTIAILQPSSFCQNKELLEFVQKDCLYLLFFALLQEQDPFISSPLYKQVTRCLPVSPSYLASKQASELFSYSDEEWWARIDLLCAA